MSSRGSVSAQSSIAYHASTVLVALALNGKMQGPPRRAAAAHSKHSSCCPTHSPITLFAHCNLLILQPRLENRLSRPWSIAKTHVRLAAWPWWVVLALRYTELVSHPTRCMYMLHRPCFGFLLSSFPTVICLSGRHIHIRLSTLARTFIHHLSFIHTRHTLSLPWLAAICCFLAF